MIVSPHPTFIYTGHEALKTLLVGVDNDAHGRIANWQHRLGKCNLLLRHRSHKVYFMGIADSMSRLPTRLQQNHVMEDSIKPDIMVTAASTIRIVPTTADLAWQRRNNTRQVYPAHKENSSKRQCSGSGGGRERKCSGSDGGREWVRNGSDRGRERKCSGSDGGRERECSGSDGEENGSAAEAMEEENESVAKATEEEKEGAEEELRQHKVRMVGQMKGKDLGGRAG